MRTELALFAQHFTRALGPLAPLLRANGERLATTGTGGLAADLTSLAAELEALLARVGSERASVFLFGPSKSGKSTLATALAGVPTGAVSSLPGVPCLVCLGHGPEPRATLLCFDGDEECLSDAASLGLRLARARAELAREVRGVHERGEAFDPARHMRTAVRRIERELPAEALERAALELVECPPVHGPLYPSYSAMLISEPDAIRSAAFVVRASQLWDEGVFAAFEELLEAFESPLLVINLDERGSAGESAASAQPVDAARLLQALEELTTSEPLARALQSDALSVTMIDLQRAATARLRGEQGGTSGAELARLADLEGAISTVLDRHSSLRALISSAGRRAEELLDEVHALGASPVLGELAREREAAESELAALERRRHALTRLAARGASQWEGEELFSGLRARLEARAVARSRELASELAATLGAEIEDWFCSAESLAGLLERRLTPRLRAAERGLAQELVLALGEELRPARSPDRSRGGGWSAAVETDSAEARLELGALLALPSEPEPRPLGLRPLDVEVIPVRATLVERLTLRGPAQVRRAFLGPPEDPGRTATSLEKERRLGREALAVLKRSAEERALAILGEWGRAGSRALADVLITSFHGAVHAQAEGQLAERVAPQAALEARLAGVRELHDGLRALETAAGRARAELLELAERFPEAGTIVPVPSARRVILPAPDRPRARALEDQPALE